MSQRQSLMDQCLQRCAAVVQAAGQCADSCLSGGQADTMQQCIRLCLDAATISGACAELMARDSSFSGQACGVCAEVCEACATECERHDGDNLQQCAEACRACAHTCRQMAA
ncbi:four-helix bundle copper-binding protein [soil metagenome]